MTPSSLFSDVDVRGPLEIQEAERGFVFEHSPASLTVNPLARIERLPNCIEGARRPLPAFRRATMKNPKLPDVPNDQIVHAISAAEKIMRKQDKLAHTKYKGLSTLDEFNEVSVLLATAMFQLGVVYGRQR